MKILFVADFRSPISQNWVRYFVERGDRVFLASTFACDPGMSVERLEFFPVAFSAVRQRGSRQGSGAAHSLNLRTKVRHWLGPLTIGVAALRLRKFIREVQPDLVHALRIPYEGMLAASALRGLKNAPPFLVSVWGNDFTLHAASSPLMKYYTRKTLKSVHALHADCERDVRLAAVWGLSQSKPCLVTPGNGGIRMDLFFPPQEPVTAPVVINPRGFRAYVRNDVFFKAIPLVLEHRPDVRFIASAMQDAPQALRWIQELGLEHAVRLDPPLAHEQMGAVFRTAQVVVSPSIHDGTPNSLLEAMACGCFPIAGDLESIREWITHGQNGFLVDPNQPQSLADAILVSLQRDDLRREAAALNERIISARAEYGRNMERVLEFYKSLLFPFPS